MSQKLWYQLRKKPKMIPKYKLSNHLNVQQMYFPIFIEFGDLLIYEIALSVILFSVF